MKIRSLLIISLILSLISIKSSASAQPLENCRISASKGQAVSLGFPINPERLSNILNPKILVIPYGLRNASFSFGDKEKSLFQKASENIYNLSSGRSRVTFAFNNIVDLGITVQEMDSVKNPQNNDKTWQERYTESTWGFVKKFITDQDTKIDYSGFDGVLFVSYSSISQSYIAEAMTMRKDALNSWYAPMLTSEGPINNVILLYNSLNELTLTHEVMHLYGLTDLYYPPTFGVSTPISPPFSLMVDGGGRTLLAWEQWVLGWLPDENVQCVLEKNDIKPDSVNNTFSIDYSNGNQLLVIPSSATSALIVDVIKKDDRRWLYFYSLDNEARPPIATFKSNDVWLVTDITNNLGVGTYIESPKYTLLIKDNDGRKLSLSLIPKAIASSESAKQLLIEAENTRIGYAKAALAVKKTTITCVKGKLTKKVTAAKPVCPSGYKKK
jgi:M6 family metalloprotease-like protein